MRWRARSWRSCKARTRRKFTKRQKDYPRRATKNGQRATKALEDAREGPAKGRAGGRSKDPPGARASRPHKAHLGARASRPHKDWHEGREPRKGGFGAPCKGVALDGRLFAGIGCGRDARAPRGCPTEHKQEPAATLRTSTPSSDVPTPPARTDSTSSESVDLFLGPFSRWRQYGS